VGWSSLAYFLKVIDRIEESYKWIFDQSGGMDSKRKSAYKRSGLADFGYVSWLYEVAENGMCGNLTDVKNMNMWEFISVLSYVRCSGKFQQYCYE
jgi:hypothetical protein